jgi:hypothetical protein
MLGRHVVKRNAEIESKLSAETKAIMEGMNVYSPMFGGGDKEVWNAAAKKFNAAAIAEIGEEAKAILRRIF